MTIEIPVEGGEAHHEGEAVPLIVVTLSTGRQEIVYGTLATFAEAMVRARAMHMPMRVTAMVEQNPSIATAYVARKREVALVEGHVVSFAELTETERRRVRVALDKGYESESNGAA